MYEWKKHRTSPGMFENLKSNHITLGRAFEAHIVFTLILILVKNKDISNTILDIKTNIGENV